VSIVALVGQKGGSGKSTTAIALAVEWHARGRRVLLVDADPQGSTRTWGDVAGTAGHPAPTVAALGTALHANLPSLAASFDRVVVDCPPRLGDVQRAALLVCDLAVLPCGPGTMDAWALAESGDAVRTAQQLRPDLRAVVLITRKVARTTVGAGAREALAGAGLPVLTTELGYRVTYQEAPAAGQGPTTYDPSSPAAEEIRALATELDQLLHLPAAPRVRRPRK
jgi:chromosome partitioning protein